jgi:hypothetical protein
MYRDVLRAADGSVLWDRGWNHNAIVVSCRRLLAAFMKAPSPSVSIGIQGLRVGQGDPGWDANGTPTAQPTQSALVDSVPFIVPKSALAIDFLDGGNATAAPTNRLQIVATLGPNIPSWPDNATHATGNLREFGLFGQLNGVDTLINYVTHPVIVKDPTSTLTRTIWLVF